MTTLTRHHALSNDELLALADQRYADELIVELAHRLDQLISMETKNDIDHDHA